MAEVRNNSELVDYMVCLIESKENGGKIQTIKRKFYYTNY